MSLSPALRKALLAIHIAASVGWIGALAAYLALDLTVATSADAGTLRACYVAMDLVVARAIVPLAAATLATGIAIALGTRWGLFRHYWVIVSLVLTVLAFAVLLVEARTVASLAALAADAARSDAEILALPSTLPHSVGGMVVLAIVLVLNLYKPRGVTPYGWRRQREEAAALNDAPGAPGGPAQR